MLERRVVPFIEHGYRRVRETPITAPPPEQPIGAAGRPKHLVRADRCAWLLDARGGLIEIARVSRVGEIAQVYISATSPGVVKAWHLHAQQTDRFFVVRGRLLVATFDVSDPTADVNEWVLDASTGPIRVTIPPGIAHGWMALGTEEAWVLNCVSHEYDGTDEFRRDPNLGPTPAHEYDWHRRRDG